MADDLYGMLFGDSEDAKRSSKAMSDLLKYKKGMALVGSMAGGPMANAAMMEKQAAGEEKTQLTGLDNRMRYGQEAQQWKDALAQRAEQNRYQIATMNANADLQRSDMEGQYKLLVQAGKEADTRAAEKDALAAAKENRKNWFTFADKFNPTVAAGRNPLGLTENLLNRTERLKSLVDSGGNPDVVITSQLVRELEMGIASLGSAGSSGQIAKSAVDEIAFKTLGRNLAEAVQWATGHPQDSAVKEFVHQSMYTLAREHEVMKGQQRRGVAMGAVTRRDLFDDPQIQPLARSYFKMHGFPDKDIEGIIAGTYADDNRPGAAPAAPGARKKYNRVTGEFE